MKRVVSVILFSLGIVLLSCSILKNEDPEKNVRNFLLAFQTDLTKSNEEILAKFRVKQSHEAVLSVISILQNKDPFVVCEASIADAQITFVNELVKIEIPSTFRLKDISSKDTESFTLVMWLTPAENDFQVTQLDGEEFYQTFQKIKNSNSWEMEQKLALKERLWIYENARKLEEKYDSVIWYAAYGQQNYFYVVKGNWNNYFLSYEARNKKNTGVKMGLVDAKGEIIIPIEYDLIGTIGFERGDMIELTKDGKVGYFDLEKKKIVIEPIYSVIIPNSMDQSWGVVKKDSVYGWLDESFAFTPGFASKRMEQWLKNFDYLKQEIQLKPGRYVFAEVPNADYAGNGIIIPPSYLSRNGIFEEIEGGISTTKVPISGWTEYKETTGSFLETISDNINAVVTTIRERYLEGREEFYTSSTLAFVDSNLDTLIVTSISGEEISMRPIDSTMLEVRTPHDNWFMENEACEENNLYSHTYFSISASNEVKALQSSRLFPQTQFVKLDSTYLTGNFRIYKGGEEEVQTNFLSVKTITFMRDEILASYGYTFPDKVLDERFDNIRPKNSKRYSNVEDVETQMTEVDKHNLYFLNKILELLQSKPA